MGRNQYSYPPEYRARMVELVRGREDTGGTGPRVRADSAVDPQLGPSGEPG